MVIVIVSDLEAKVVEDREVIIVSVMLVIIVLLAVVVIITVTSSIIVIIFLGWCFWRAIVASHGDYYEG